MIALLRAEIDILRSESKVATARVLIDYFIENIIETSIVLDKSPSKYEADSLLTQLRERTISDLEKIYLGQIIEQLQTSMNSKRELIAKTLKKMSHFNEKVLNIEIEQARNRSAEANEQCVRDRLDAYYESLLTIKQTYATASTKIYNMLKVLNESSSHLMSMIVELDEATDEEDEFEL